VRVKLYRDILEANDIVAAQTRRLLDEKGIFCLNLIGSPGSGKTTLLELTVEHLLAEGRLHPAVIEGDIATTRDAERIEAKGATAVQINTEGGCHLDAGMMRAALEELPLNGTDVIFVENVGNLICPADFDLGEHAKVIVYSVAEGDDKPLKYPLAFRRAAVVVISKMDLLPHVTFDLAKVKAEIATINPELLVFPLSARTGEGLGPWFEWVCARADT